MTKNIKKAKKAKDAKSIFNSLDELADWFKTLSNETAHNSIGHRPSEEHLMQREAAAYLVVG